jgi:hypothetical protein
MVKSGFVLTLAVLGAAACHEQITSPDAPAAPSASRRTSPGPYVVHGVYLVPSDRPLRHDYARQIGDALENLQVWYQNELPGGVTFTLAKPTVDIVRTVHPASYYTGGAQALDFWYTALNDGFDLTGGRFYDPEAIWIYYIDADPLCGQSTGAIASVALLPANDLRGLAGEPTTNLCTGEREPSQGRCRWVGGLGHELGHALGLPHPSDCEAGLSSCPANALMWLGYQTYPDAILTADDQAVLVAEPFFTALRLPSRLPSCAGHGHSTLQLAARLMATSGLRVPACGYEAVLAAAPKRLDELDRAIPFMVHH